MTVGGSFSFRAGVRALLLVPFVALAVNAAMNPNANKDYWEGMYYLRRNSTLEKAIASMERAVAEDPASPLTYAGLAEARKQQNRDLEGHFLELVEAAKRQGG